MLRVELNLEDKSEWIKVFDPRDYAVFLAGDEAGREGDEIRVDLRVGSDGPLVILRGTVITHRDEPSGSAPAGTMVALGAEEREKVNYLNGFVRGGLLDLRERRRLPLRIPVTYGGLDGPQKSYTRDLNEEGIFVVSEQPLPEDSEIHVLLEFPDHDEPMSLAGRVSHTVVVEDEDVPGMGIVLELETSTRAELKKIIDDLEERFLRAALPEALLL